jgi:hypothetical protein
LQKVLSATGESVYNFQQIERASFLAGLPLKGVSLPISQPGVCSHFFSQALEEARRI